LTRAESTPSFGAFRVQTITRFDAALQGRVYFVYNVRIIFEGDGTALHTLAQPIAFYIAGFCGQG